MGQERVSDDDNKDFYALMHSLVELKSNDFKNKNVEDDNDFRSDTTGEITKRDKEYTELLSFFVGITKVRSVLKEFFKWLFYAVVVASIIVVIVLTVLLFNKYIKNASFSELIDALPLLITAMVGLISTIITIPVVITKYLFDTAEDKNITSIILHTQEHDTSGRQWAMDYRNITDSSKKR